MSYIASSVPALTRESRSVPNPVQALAHSPSYKMEQLFLIIVIRCFIYLDCHAYTLTLQSLAIVFTL